MCSLQEAFQPLSDTPASVMPRNEEPPRRKKKRTALPPPEPQVIDPDRPSFRRMAAGTLLQSTASAPSAMLNAFDYDTDASAYFPNPSNDVDTKDAFLLEPDWTKVFSDTSAPDWLKARMPSRDTEVPLEPAAWLDGSATLWANVPKPAAAARTSATTSNEARLDDLQRRMDAMFQKLEDMDVTRSESNLLELLLFVLGGVFLLLLVDMLVKQGMRTTLLLAHAGGGTVFRSMFGLGSGAI